MPLTHRNYADLADLYASPLWPGVKAALLEMVKDSHTQYLVESSHVQRAQHRLDQWTGRELGVTEAIDEVEAAQDIIHASATDELPPAFTADGNAADGEIVEPPPL